MPRFTITDHRPYCEAAAGDTVYFEFGGQPYYVEYWATRHGSGIDTYDARHRAVELFAEHECDEFEEQIRAFLAALGEAEEALDVPGLRRQALAMTAAALNG